ncbi:phage holin family protein [Streptomyces sp. HD1123-B1]|uniref:phage holin family protein n=1 Tax=Streptomyces huangiella TaxID=3228804 RepID=UPI003D7D966D
MTEESARPGPGDGPAVPSAGEPSDPVARIVREEIREELRVLRDEIRDEIRGELREELREQSRQRTVRLWGGAAAIAFYAGAVFTACLVLLFALAMPGWAAALIVGAMLMVLAAVLKNSAGRPPRARPQAQWSPRSQLGAKEPPAPATPPAPPTPPEPPAEPPGPPHRG